MNKISLIIPIFVNSHIYGMAEEFLELEATENFVWPENLTSSSHISSEYSEPEQANQEDLQEENIVASTNINPNDIILGIDSTEHYCFICGQLLNRKNKTHGLQHKNKSSFKCPIKNCKSSFDKFCLLNLHVANHIKPFKCSDCKYSCPTKALLAMHLRVHTGYRPFQCPECDFTAKQSSTLRSHIISKHSISKLYRCGYPGCKFTYKEVKARKEHMKIHNNRQDGKKTTKKRKEIENLEVSMAVPQLKKKRKS